MNNLNIDEFIFNLPLYTSIEINKSNIHEFLTLVIFRGTIEGYNPVKKQNTTYSVIERPSDSVSNTQQSMIYAYEGIKKFVIRCVRDGYSITTFLRTSSSIEEINGEDITVYRVEKIGQSPSIATLHISKIKQYDGVLSKDKLKEITRAVGLAANGVGIGSFVYLRRVFEGLIEEAHRLAIKDEGWDDTAFGKERMAEKIEMLRHHLPEFLVENKAMYSILSKGIHELEENECLNYFDAVKVGIELILDEKVELFEKKKKMDEAKKRLQSIGQELGKK